MSEVYDNVRFPGNDLVEHARTITNIERGLRGGEQLPVAELAGFDEVSPKKSGHASDQHQAFASWSPTHLERGR